MISVLHLLWIVPSTMFLTIFCLSLAYAASDFENYKSDETEDKSDDRETDMGSS